MPSPSSITSRTVSRAHIRVTVRQRRARPCTPIGHDRFRGAAQRPRPALSSPASEAAAMMQWPRAPPPRPTQTDRLLPPPSGDAFFSRPPVSSPRLYHCPPRYMIAAIV
ncbi:hypothetical protein CRG98_037497 [Punica granatum]|uniref:Uncharacterized protein n=1 Tax=Punica granatum TaxID=22663 RepID=A0A2I0IDH0_PUNGR|nr:hypothetical protein CRG98_037497 [Punica granatum]